MLLDYITRKALLTYLSLHLFTFAAMFFIPFEATSGEWVKLQILNLTFITLTTSTAVLISKTRIATPLPNLDYTQEQRIKKTIKWCSMIAILGVFFISYDRLFIRGIDYSEGLRAARYQWLGTTGGSGFGILGNLFLPMAYVGVFLLYIHKDLFKLKNFFFILVTCLGPIFGHAALNGGRSNLLLAAVILLCAHCLRRRTPETSTARKSPFFLICGLSLIFLAATAYIFYIIKSSARMGAVETIDLLYLGAESLYGTPKNGRSIDQLSDLESMLIYTIIYLIHGQWTSQISLSESTTIGSYFLHPFSVLLSRTGLFPEALNSGMFSESGALISLPGALAYDFGPLGVVFGSIFLGISLGFCFRSLKGKRGLSGVGLAFVVYILSTTFLSPFITASGFFYLNFIFFGFLATGLIHFAIYRKRVRLV